MSRNQIIAMACCTPDLFVWFLLTSLIYVRLWCASVHLLFWGKFCFSHFSDLLFRSLENCTQTIVRLLCKGTYSLLLIACNSAIPIGAFSSERHVSAYMRAVISLKFVLFLLLYSICLYIVVFTILLYSFASHWQFSLWWLLHVPSHLNKNVYDFTTTGLPVFQQDVVAATFSVLRLILLYLEDAHVSNNDFLAILLKMLKEFLHTTFRPGRRNSEVQMCPCIGNSLFLKALSLTKL